MFSLKKIFGIGEVKKQEKKDPNAWMLQFNGKYGEDKIDLGIKPDSLCIDLPAFVDVFMSFEGAVLIQQSLKDTNSPKLREAINKIVEKKAEEEAAIQQVIDILKNNQQKTNSDSYIKPSQVFKSSQHKQ